jgi:hypothetical protein
MEMKSDIKKSQSVIVVASSLYMALAYVSGIIIFIIVLRYPELTSDIDKLKMIVEMKSAVFATNIFLYVLFGPILVLFILFLKSQLRNNGTLLIEFSSTIGFIWAGSLVASGMISNAAIKPLAELLNESPEKAVHLWKILDSIPTGLGNGNGEILGGLMTLGFGIAMLMEADFNRGLGIFGILVGVIGIISLIPSLVDLCVVFGILQLVWFVLTGFSIIKLAGKKA